MLMFGIAQTGIQLADAKTSAPSDGALVSCSVMISAPCSHLGIEGAEAGAGAMLAACRLAGLSALESRLCGRSCSRATVGDCGRRDSYRTAVFWPFPR